MCRQGQRGVQAGYLSGVIVEDEDGNEKTGRYGTVYGAGDDLRLRGNAAADLAWHSGGEARTGEYCHRLCTLSSEAVRSIFYQCDENRTCELSVWQSVGHALQSGRGNYKLCGDGDSEKNRKVQYLRSEHYRRSIP